MKIKCEFGAGSTDLNVPDICPRCGKNFAPSTLFYSYLKSTDKKINFVALLSCPFCNKATLIEYPWSNLFSVNPRYEDYWPNIQIYDLPNGIADLYPAFSKTYNEAALAEAMGITKIAGMGYRKALEELIEHYLSNHPEIECNPDAPLGKKVLKIANPKIQALAKASVWLGNDQVHTKIKFPEYDINDLKSFIKALCYFILMEAEIDKATKLISTPSS